MRRAIAFYDGVGFARKMSETGEQVAFFETGGSVLALFPWDKLADDASTDDAPRPKSFRGVTLAWNCNSREDVDAVLAHALSSGAELRRPASETDYGGYRGYFADPDGHLWEAVVAPGIVVREDGRLSLPD